jgi:hypothetical protein
MAAQTDPADKPPSVFAQAFEDGLVFVVTSIVRAGAKAVESLTDDAVKAINNKKKEVEAVRDAVKAWRKMKVGEVEDSDVPASLRDD